MCRNSGHLWRAWRLRIRAFLWFCVALCPIGGLQASGLPDTIKKIKPSVVGVGTFAPLRQIRSAFLGTGWAIADGRHIVTNCHVVNQRLDPKKKEAHAVFLPRPGKQPKAFKARIVARDKRHDLCLLKIEGVKLPPLKLGRAVGVEEGKLYALTGFPIGMVLGLRPVTHQGIVSAITPIAIPAISGKQLTQQMLSHLSRPFDVFQLDATAYRETAAVPCTRSTAARWWAWSTACSSKVARSRL